MGGNETMTFEEMRDMLDKIIKDDKDAILEVPLKDLVWAIICFSTEMKNYEDDAFMGKGQEKYRNNLIIQREYSACRRDELAGIINRYSDYDTQKIWNEVDKIFDSY